MGLFSLRSGFSPTWTAGLSRSFLSGCHVKKHLAENISAVKHCTSKFKSSSDSSGISGTKVAALKELGVFWQQSVGRGSTFSESWRLSNSERAYRCASSYYSTLGTASMSAICQALKVGKSMKFNSTVNSAASNFNKRQWWPAQILLPLQHQRGQVVKQRSSTLRSMLSMSERRLYTNLGGQVAFRRNFWSGNEAVWGILLANGAVFAAWQVVSPHFMEQHFMVSDENIRKGRWHTIVTSAFSHKELFHIASNMVAFGFFGLEICQLYGGRYLLGLYLAGGVTASICHLVYYRFILPDLEKRRGRYFASPFNPPALGASGAVNAVVLLNCLNFPTRIVWLNLIIPVPGILLGLGFIWKDFYGATTKQDGNIGHAAHLGGAFVGLLAWLLRMLRM